MLCVVLFRASVEERVTYMSNVVVCDQGCSSEVVRRFLIVSLGAPFSSVYFNAFMRGHKLY